MDDEIQHKAQELAQQNPDYLIMFRAGDHFVLMAHSALVAATALSDTKPALLAFDGAKPVQLIFSGAWPECDTYVSALLNAGQRVLQVEFQSIPVVRRFTGGA